MNLIGPGLELPSQIVKKLPKIRHKATMEDNKKAEQGYSRKKAKKRTEA